MRYSMITTAITESPLGRLYIHTFQARITGGGGAGVEGVGRPSPPSQMSGVPHFAGDCDLFSQNSGLYIMQEKCSFEVHA